jgi:hypothetical protein
MSVAFEPDMRPIFTARANRELNRQSAVYCDLRLLFDAMNTNKAVTQVIGCTVPGVEHLCMERTVRIRPCSHFVN